MVTDTYQGIEIVLLETENKWRFTVNGRERTTQTLPDAREAINRALANSEKKKQFEPIEAYKGSDYGLVDYKLVKITSFAEPNYRNEYQAWITKPDGSREKSDLSSLFVVNSETENKIKRIKQLLAERDQLSLAARELQSSLERIKPPVEESNA